TPAAQTPASTTPGAGSPQDAQAIAQRVDPGLVDVNTQLTINGQPAVGAGTGMVLTPDGEVLTNNHVIEGATKISVTDVGNGRTYGATVVGYDRSHDVAVLQMTGASGLQTVTTGNSSTLSVGEGVVAVGNAEGAGGTPSYAGGSITALNQTITASDEATGTSEQLTGLIQTNADIVSGDSGGALVNSNGRVIGMNTAATSGYQFQSPSSQGYAIPINAALSVVRQIESGTSVGTVHVGPTAFLGVEVESASANGGGLFGGGGSSANGATIVGLVSGGAAAQAGLVPGDVITSLDGHPVTSAESLTNVMVLEKPGKAVSVTYLNTSGQQATTSVTLASGPPQ
ncbi:MAG TPA: trypsin-like peptidase domain-containing protein, partial [Acidimicrobiales bacterium]|nr:trypsin-like peptidase domain-containing protein [Acidimicrobiales bacterium]